MTDCGGSAVPRRRKTWPRWASRRSGCPLPTRAPRRRTWATAFTICMISGSLTRRERSVPSTEPKKNTLRRFGLSTQPVSVSLPTLCSTTAWAGMSWRRSPLLQTTPKTAGNRSAEGRKSRPGRSLRSPAATVPTAALPGITGISQAPTGTKTARRPATSTVLPESTGHRRPIRKTAPSTI